MQMVTKFSERNSYGGYTYEIKIEVLFRIYIHSTNTGEYVVEFKEFKTFSRKVRFSFISHEDIKETLHNAFERVYDWFYNHKSYVWTEDQFWRSRTQAMKEIDHYI